MTINSIPKAPAATGATTVTTETPVSCPSCHTARPGVTHGTWDSGGQWRCERCGERWTPSRLATVTEYEAWQRAQTV